MSEKNMKGYKQTEVGLIPEEWEVKKIGAFTDACSGGTPSTLVKDYWNGEIRWMNSGELNLKKVYEVENRITELGLTYSATKLIPQNCVLIGLAGQGKTRGTVAINKIELCTNQSIAAIFPCETVDYNFLYFNLDSRYFELRGLSTGDGGRGGLNLTIIKNLLVPLPPTKSEQTAIANALSDADALITSLEKLIEKKRAIKQGAMQELLKPKAGWVDKEIGEIFQFKQGVQCAIENQKTQEGLGLKRFIRIIDLTQPSEMPRFIEDPGSSHHIRAEDLFMVRYGNPGLLGFGFEGVIANNLFRLIPKIKIETNFFYFLLTYKNEKILQLTSSTTMAALNFTSLNSLRISFPISSEEQTRIATILSDMDSEITALEQKLAKYKQIKQGMMQELLTGKIRLV